MRQTGDLGCVPVTVWESGVLDLLPDCIDHATVGAARDGGPARRGADARRRRCARARRRVAPVDRGAAPPASSTTSPRATRPSWGWRDDVGLVPLANRYSFFGPDALDVRGGAGFPHPVPRIAAEGWARARRRLAPSWPPRSRPLPPGAVGAARRAGRDAQHACSTATGSSRTSAPTPRRAHGARRLVDVGRGSAAHRAAALRSRSTGRASPHGHGHDDVPSTAYRAALERRGVDTAPWWERQLVAVPARRDAAARLGEGVRRHRPELACVDGPRVDDPLASSLPA